MQPLRYSGTSDNFWTCREAITISCYSNNYLKVLNMQSMLNDLLRRKDLTAADVNAASTSSGVNKFFTFDVMGSLPPDPAMEEGGRYGSSIITEYEYVKNIDNSGRYV